MALRIDEIKSGMTVYESAGGENIKVTILTDPRSSENNPDRYEFEGILDSTGELIYYTITKGFEFYGPKLYEYPPYVTMPNIKNEISEILGIEESQVQDIIAKIENSNWDEIND